MLVLDGLTFDRKVGEILLPEEDAIPFRSTAAIGIGVQVTSKRGPGFTLTLTRYGSPANVEAERNSVRLRIGTLVSLTDYYDGNAINYSLSGYLFAVTQARVIEAKTIAAWHGYRLGVFTKLDPAIRMTSQWTMYAKPGVV